jgi:ferredoxin-NADP reductase
MARETAQSMAAARRATAPPRGSARTLRTRLAGVADLFAWPLRVSHYLELVNPLWSSHLLRARVERVCDETDDARTLILRPGRGWRSHRAGQFVAVTVTIDGTRHVRTYSISSAPEHDRTSECIAITVKGLPGGRVSNHLVRDLEPGAYVALGLAQGDFVLPEAMPVRPLFITAGSGITPVMSMLRSLEAGGALPDIVHLHYAPSAGDVIFADELARLARTHPRYRLHVVHTRTPGDEQSPRRHFSAEALDALCPDWRQRDCYACGPRGLLAALEAHWAQAGAAPRLHLERFQAILADAPADTTGGRVLFAKSGLDVVADGGTSLLRVAEANGLNPPHGCRMGICHSCTATLLSGCVRDVRDNRLTSESGTRVQICVSAAAGNCELEL